MSYSNECKRFMMKSIIVVIVIIVTSVNYGLLKTKFMN